MKKLTAYFLVGGVVVVAAWLWLRPDSPESLNDQARRPAGTAAEPPSASLEAPVIMIAHEDPIPAGLVGAGLNAPDGTAREDLRILQGVFRAWQRRGKDTGNPVGTNREITAALTGRNIWRLSFLPPDHPAINEQGELCDRWGTPLYFHQLSGTRMEVRSHGPDRIRFTEDDVVL